MTTEEFVDLERRFHEVSMSATDDDTEIRSLVGLRNALAWTDLVKHQRVVILAAAGAGKTVEISQAARRLRKDGKPAFFLRLEHVADGLSAAFEIGTFDEFNAWKDGTGPGWILLDSVDEARLRDPLDFERAIRSLASALGMAKQRAHIVITSRLPAWRPKTDLELCSQQFGLTPAGTEVALESASESRISELRPPDMERKHATIFKVVTLADLTRDHVRCFSEAKGVTDPGALLEAIDRAAAWSFTTRPQDLGYLIEFWMEHNRIGNRHDLMKNNIHHRLEERDQRRADARPIQADRLRDAACQIAAACTLSHTQNIRVPDGAANTKGLPVKEILPDWDDRDCATLLARPLFNDAQYGTVRFHHRWVREYLAAEWFSRLLNQDASRARVEELFFQEQYGLQVIVPGLRPVLPWLALMDSRILERTLRVAPEVLLEGGDPSQLPLEVRRSILSEVCDRAAEQPVGRTIADYDAVLRFAAADLTPDINDLLTKYSKVSSVQEFLLRMVWQGRLNGALNATKAVALDPQAELYARIAAFRALAAIGSALDLADVRRSFQTEASELDRQWLSELVESSEPTVETVRWLFDCIGRTPSPKKHHVESLPRAVAEYFSRAPVSLLHSIVDHCSDLLGSEPFVEHRSCEVSRKFLWCLAPATVVMRRLLEGKIAYALAQPSLDLLHKIPLTAEYKSYDFDDEKLDLRQSVREWPELHLALFWHIVEYQRKHLGQKDKPLTDWWHAEIWSSYVNFTQDDFSAVLRCVGRMPIPDDNLVALSLAHHLYVASGRPEKLQIALQTAVQDDRCLSEQLSHLMRPNEITKAHAEHLKKEALRQERSAARAKQEEIEEQNWRAAMRANPESLRTPRLKKPEDISNWQYCVYQRMRYLGDRTSTRESRDWRVLENEFGYEVACAFRDGAITYWRRNRPSLRCEGATANILRFAETFGLAGLDFEASQADDWPSTLSEEEAELAFRYAMHELNGFPDWMPKLFSAFPHVIVPLVLKEVQHELLKEKPDVDSYYLLYDISWHGEWIWDAVASDFYDTLRTREPRNVSNLRYLLKALNGSSLPDAEIARLASRKTKTLKREKHLAVWYAVWVGVDPEAAIPSLQSRLAEITCAEAKLNLAMLFAISLGGGRRSGGSSARTAYRKVTHLKELYLLLHEHIRRDDDIDRAGTGVYSPDMRDNAQDARDHLYTLLEEIPGKATYLALEDIAREHPNRTSRPWFTGHAKRKAEADANLPPWTIKQVRDFQDTLERTPRTHRELHDLACMRLLDLKADLEDGDSSIAETLRKISLETEMRTFIGHWCRENAKGRYHIPQEEELADAKRPDLRFMGTGGLDGPVPVELKLAENWSGGSLIERLEVQLCGDYLRDQRSSRGIFLLVHRGNKPKSWKVPGSDTALTFPELSPALQNHWKSISHRYPGVDAIKVIGIDLSKRLNRTGAAGVRANS